MRTLLLIVGSLTSAPVLADCPTAADLQTGIRFTAANGDTDTYVAQSDGVVVANFRDGGGNGTEVTLANGLYILSFSRARGTEVDSSSTARWEYPVSHAELPDPVPDTEWSVEATLTAPEGTETQSQAYSAGATTEMTLGDCTYPMLPIEATFRADTTNYYDRLHYFPTLGLAYVAAHGDLGQAPQFQVQNVGIEALD